MLTRKKIRSKHNRIVWLRRDGNGNGHFEHIPKSIYHSCHQAFTYSFLIHSIESHSFQFLVCGIIFFFYFSSKDAYRKYPNNNNDNNNKASRKWKKGVKVRGTIFTITIHPCCNEAEKHTGHCYLPHHFIFLPWTSLQPEAFYLVGTDYHYPSHSIEYHERKNTLFYST